jgi:hypothetical protein
MMRTDEATEFFGVRINVFTSVIVFLGALAYFLIKKGPREYVVPIDAPETAPEPEAGSDVSQVDVSAGDEDATERATPPKAYQVVSEERFREYERTGILPPVAAAEVPAAGQDETPAASSASSADER